MTACIPLFLPDCHAYEHKHTKHIVMHTNNRPLLTYFMQQNCFFFVTWTTQWLSIISFNLDILEKSTILREETSWTPPCSVVFDLSTVQLSAHCVPNYMMVLTSRIVFYSTCRFVAEWHCTLASSLHFLLCMSVYWWSSKNWSDCLILWWLLGFYTFISPNNNETHFKALPQESGFESAWTRLRCQMEREKNTRTVFGAETAQLKHTDLLSILGCSEVFKIW